jgi:hypothetical protein
VDGGKNMNKIRKKIKIAFCILAGVFILMPSTIAFDFNEYHLYQQTIFKKLNTRDPIVDKISLLQINYWLNGTILDGTRRVIISPDGRPPDGTKPGSYDYVITFEQAQKIADQARQQYIKKYGIDPYSKFGPNPDYNKNNMKDSIPNPYPPFEGPHKKNGEIYLKIFFPINGHFACWFPQLDAVLAAHGFGGFHTYYSVTTYVHAYFGVWPCSVPDNANMKDILDDLSGFCEMNGYWTPDDYNVVCQAFVRNAAGDFGDAYQLGFYSIVKEWNPFRLDLASRHEVSHNFGANDHGWWPWPICIMSLFWLGLYYGIWCNDCHDIIKNQINS